ncbi:ABC transporter transmembrane domain-containing protein, partial [Paenibacillus tundrae]
MNELAILSKAMIQERKDIILSILGGFIAGIAGVALFSASGYLISQTVFAPPLYTLIVLTSLVKLLGLLRAASRYGERLYSHRATFSMLSRLRTSFFARLIPLTPGILNKKRSGDLLARIVGDVESLQHYFLRVAYPPIIVVMVFLATVLFTSAFSFWIAGLFVLGMLITALVVPGLVLLGQRKIHGHVREQRALLSTEVTEVLYGFRDLKVYGQLAQREQQLQQASAALTVQQQRA